MKVNLLKVGKESQFRRKRQKQSTSASQKRTDPTTYSVQNSMDVTKNSISGSRSRKRSTSCSQKKSKDKLCDLTNHSIFNIEFRDKKHKKKKSKLRKKDVYNEGFARQKNQISESFIVCMRKPKQGTSKSSSGFSVNRRSPSADQSNGKPKKPKALRP
mmetsp:Transcript_22603/g.21772  ORF Transcript_22603/g.21772 Transcript_22603/m.21772 type:complete len:158 (+) Transcript_22603:1075-1548(+)